MPLKSYSASADAGPVGFTRARYSTPFSAQTTLWPSRSAHSQVGTERSALRSGCSHSCSSQYTDVPCGWFTSRSEEHMSELQSRPHLVCRLLLEKKKNKY